jgi:hypothetical protein
MLNIKNINYDEREKLQDSFESYVKDEMLVFYGVWDNQFKLNDKVFEALEDPDDGYRSYLGTIAVVETESIFFPNPLAAVKVVKLQDIELIGNKDEPTDGYAIVDVFDGHIWLKVGTEYGDGYYPCFIFQYFPKLNTAL